MYKALESFATVKPYKSIQQGQILESDFASQEEIDEYLRIGYIKEYDGSLDITENGTYDVKEYEEVDVNVSGGEINLQDKEVTISTNTTTTISADSGYDGLGEVEVTTNIPIPVQRDWTELGYSGEPEFIEAGFQYAKQILQNWDPSITNVSGMFRESRQLRFLPDLDMSNVTDMSTFANNNSHFLYAKLTHINNVTIANSAFETTRALVKLILGNATFSNMKYFLYGSAVQFADLSGIEISNNCDLGSAFNGTVMICKLDISKMDFSNFSGSFSQMFNNCGVGSKQALGAYADGIPYIYVKDPTAQDWVLTANNGHPSTWTTDNVVIKQS